MTAAPSRDGLGLRNLLPILVLDIACPYVAYGSRRPRAPRAIVNAFLRNRSAVFTLMLFWNETAVPGALWASQL